MIRWAQKQGRRIAAWFGQVRALIPSWADPRIKIAFTDHEPTKLRPQRLYVTSTPQGPSFGYMLCPCGCRETLHVRFLPDRRPRWDLQIEIGGAVSLKPSVWRQVGCRSHFILSKGRVYWC
jgi:hypothetical protein